MATRKHFSQQFKHQAGQLLESGSHPASEIGRELGLARKHLYPWQTEMRSRGIRTFPRSGARKERIAQDRAVHRGIRPLHRRTR